MTVPQQFPTDDYVCAVCYVPLYFNKMRFIPDILCFDCHGQWQDEREKPWLDELCKVERRRRERFRKLRRGGYSYDFASLDALFGADDLIDEDSDGSDGYCNDRATELTSDSDEIDTDD